MKAAWYEKQGPAREVLTIGQMPDPITAAGEVRIRIAASGVNPGDVKKRQDAFGIGLPYPRVIPHSDEAGTVDKVGDGIASEWIGDRCGATERSHSVRLVPLRSLRSFLSITSLLYPNAFR